MNISKCQAGSVETAMLLSVEGTVFNRETATLEQCDREGNLTYANNGTEVANAGGKA